jgi:methylenetetrahydrofolate reductase (NADPH)
MSLPIPISFEFFPPKSPQGAEKLREIRAQLYAAGPQFCSVTYGAGGSTQQGTFATVGQIHDEGIEAASHLSCIGASHETITEHLNTLRDMGVRRIVALRGDLPSGFGLGGEFHYASDLVTFIRAQTADHFHIEVACYPEFHPQARSPDDDLRAFAKKVRAGANSAITQYFFSAAAYFRFVKDASRLGVTIPIVPGIMPITNAVQLLRFSDSCGAEIPRWIRARLQALEGDPQAIADFGLDVVTDLCQQLINGGAPGLHFYTLNQASPVLALCERLGAL